MRVPIKDRIRAAMNGKTRIEYHDLMRAVFPVDQYPNAFRYQCNGCPPGCAMAFGKALRELGATDSGQRSSPRVVYLKP